MGQDAPLTRRFEVCSVSNPFGKISYGPGSRLAQTRRFWRPGLTEADVGYRLYARTGLAVIYVSWQNGIIRFDMILW